MSDRPEWDALVLARDMAANAPQLGDDLGDTLAKINTWVARAREIAAQGDEDPRAIDDEPLNFPPGSSHSKGREQR